MKSDIYNDRKVLLRRKAFCRLQVNMMASDDNTKKNWQQGSKVGFRAKFLEAYDKTGSIEQAKKMANIANRFSDEILKRWIEESRGIEKVDDGWDR